MNTPVATLVRRATPADAAALARLRFEFRSPRAPNVETEEQFLSRCTAWMQPRLGEQSAWRVWLLDGNDGPAGNLWLQMVEKLPNPAAESELHGYVSNVYVTPSHRNGGAG